MNFPTSDTDIVHTNLITENDTVLGEFNKIIQLMVVVGTYVKNKFSEEMFGIPLKVCTSKV